MDQSKRIRELKQEIAKLHKELQHEKDKNRRHNLPGAKSIKKRDLEKKIVQLEGISEFNYDAGLKSEEKSLKLERDAEALVQQMEVLKLENHAVKLRNRELEQQLVHARSGADGKIIQFKDCTFNNTNNVMNNFNAESAIDSPPASFATTTPPINGVFVHRPEITGASSPAIAAPSLKFADTKPMYKTPCNFETPVKECSKGKCPFLHRSQLEGPYKDVIEDLPANRREQRERENATKRGS